MQIIYPLHATGFETLLDDDNKEVEKSGEEMICTILYLKNTYKAKSSNINKRVKNDYVLNKAE